MHRYATEDLYLILQHFEGFSPKLYICPAGWYTIGWGHAVRKSELATYSNREISKEEATELLKKDVYSAEASVSRLITVPLEDHQFDPLVSFTYNLGGGALQRSSLRSKLNRYEYYDAGLEFTRWVYAGGVKLSGLVRRRLVERNLFLYGILYEETWYTSTSQ